MALSWSTWNGRERGIAGIMYRESDDSLPHVNGGNQFIR